MRMWIKFTANKKKWCTAQATTLLRLVKYTNSSPVNLPSFSLQKYMYKLSSRIPKQSAWLQKLSYALSKSVQKPEREGWTEQIWLNGQVIMQTTDQSKYYLTNINIWNCPKNSITFTQIPHTKLHPGVSDAGVIFLC